MIIAFYRFDRTVALISPRYYVLRYATAPFFIEIRISSWKRLVTGMPVQKL